MVYHTLTECTKERLEMMKKCKINMVVKLLDKVMLQEACIKLECRSLSELVLLTVRGDLGYSMGLLNEPVREVPSLIGELEYPTEQAYDVDTILCVMVMEVELRIMQRIAKERLCKGVPSMVLAILRRKGFIREI